jgi:hypothetical protein
MKTWTGFCPEGECYEIDRAAPRKHRDIRRLSDLMSPAIEDRVVARARVKRLYQSGTEMKGLSRFLPAGAIDLSPGF